MSTSESKAVFLSYASQDAEAARRICDALRSGGVEVWFDADGGLEHGDEWDTKIRRQIKECVLFIPVISANTQARHEGYFRIEWDLAAERARGIASGVPFILPVVIDDTREPDALVPDRFRAVQWTKLRGGEVPSEVQQRFLKLWSHRTGVLKQQAAQVSAPANSASLSASETIGKPSGKSYALIAAAIAVIIAGVGWWLLGVSVKPASSSSAPAKSVPAPAPLSEARQLVEKARAILDALEATREDYKLAEELIAQAKAKDATDAEVCATEAQLHERFIERGWDSSQTRREAARAAVQRAIRLDPVSFEARLAQANLLGRTGREGEEKERQLRELRRERPTDQRVLRALASTLDRLGRMDEAVPIYRESAGLPGGDPLALYSLSMGYWFAGRAHEAEQVMEEAIAQKPFSSALLMSVLYKTALQGDIAGARKVIEQIDPAVMHEDRAALFAYFAEMFARSPDRAIAWLLGVPHDWLTDNWYAGPKGMLLGDAHQLAGRPEAAALEWRTALTLVEQRLKEQPKQANTLGIKVLLLAKLGQRDHAESQYALFLQIAGADLSYSMTGMKQDASRYMIALGQYAEALRSIDNFIKNNVRWPVVFPSATLRLDPLYDPLRGDPEFARIIAEVEAREKTSAAGKSIPADATATKVDDKSVAVLAFANLSDDKANEYFSDGISEELLNVLAKVPKLKVAARTSSFYFKGRNEPIPEIAQKLGVAYVVEGSVRKAGDKVRITAQLIKAADGFQVWSDQFDRDLKDVFAVQDEIAGLIAKNLSLKLTLVTKRAEINSAAYSLLLQGRFFAQKESNDGRKQAVVYYRQAVAAEPGYSLAWAELARVYVMLGRYGGLPIRDAMQEARVAAHRALDLNPDEPQGLDALGWVQRMADWDWQGARKSFQRAVELAPEDPAILGDAAILLCNIGRIDEAIILARRGVERDPLSVRAHLALGDILVIREPNMEGAAILSQAIKLAPETEAYHAILGTVLSRLQLSAEAETSVEQEPNEGYRLMARALLAQDRGNRQLSAKARDELIAKFGGSMAGWIAIVYAHQEQPDQAFVWLERAAQERDRMVSWFKNDYYLRPLNADPRWPVFLHKIGLADDQLK